MYLSFLLSRASLFFFLSLFFTYAQAEQQQAEAAKETTPVEAKSLPESPVEVPNSRSVNLTTERKLVKPAFLNKRLPESVIAYVRVPNIWEMLGSPSGNVLDPAVGSEAFVAATSSIKKGFATNLIPEFPQELHLVMRLFSQYINSPLEAVALKSPDSATPMGNVLLTAAVDFETAEAVQTVLTDLVAKNSRLQISKLMDSDGFTEITVGDKQLQVLWDKALSRLFVFLGKGPATDNFTSFIGQLESNDDHLMSAVEKI